MQKTLRHWRNKSKTTQTDGELGHVLALVVQLLSRVQTSATSWTAAHQASLSFTISRRLLNSCPLSWWCHPTILLSVIPFSFCLQTFPASNESALCSSGQNIRALVSASVFPTNIQGWFPLGLTGLISVQSKGLSRVFSNTTVQKHQFFSIQLSLESGSHIHTWLLEKS